MSTEINDGGPAFPCPGTEGVNPEAWGMSLRAYIATKAMQGLFALPNSGGAILTYETYAREAVKYADALIAELSK